jgi:LacI family transcriptional regulator
MKKRQFKAVGVREVAALAGVSFSTAAAALRGEAWVKATTRVEVEAAAARLGYRRDLAASILSSRRGQRPLAGLSVVYLAANFLQRAPGTFARRLPGLAEAAKRRGLLFERVELRDEEHAAQVAQRLRATGVDGLILGPVHAEPFFAAFPVRDYALIGDNRGLTLHGVDAVRANHFTAVQRLFLELARRGYRRVGVLLRQHREPHADDYARYGAVTAFRDLVGGLEKLEPLVWPFRRGEGGGARQEQEELHEFYRWWRKHRFDVVVGFDEREERLVAEACADDPHRPDYAAMLVRAGERGRLAGVAFDQEALVEPMLARLEEKIRGRRLGRSDNPVETVIDLPFLEGASLRRSPVQ